jgi:hypothetical protein
MTVEMGCDRVRELAPELALGIAAGEDRSAALHHLTGCQACRQLVSELLLVGDELLLRAPVHEPPPGFESRVLAAMNRPPARRRRAPSAHSHRWSWRVALTAAAIIVAGALGGGSVFMATGDDRQLAQEYRATLGEGRGSFFAATPLQGSHGRAGTVFGYEGQPSWVMVTLDSGVSEGRRLEVRIATRAGTYIDVGEVVLRGGNETWGRQIPIDLSAVKELQFVGPSGRPVFTATYGAVGPWD